MGVSDGAGVGAAAEAPGHVRVRRVPGRGRRGEQRAVLARQDRQVSYPGKRFCGEAEVIEDLVGLMCTDI